MVECPLPRHQIAYFTPPILIHNNLCHIIDLTIEVSVGQLVLKNHLWITKPYVVLGVIQEGGDSGKGPEYETANDCQGASPWGIASIVTYRSLCDVSQSVNWGRNNNPNTTPTKDYEIVRVVVYLRGVQRGCAEEGERGSTPTG